MGDDTNPGRVRRMLEETSPERELARKMLVPSKVTAVLEYLAERRERSQRNAGEVLDAAAREANREVSDLLERIEANDDLAVLAAQVLDAAMRTAMEQKVRLLGRALGQAVADDAMVDESILVTAALAELEPPHLRVLASIASRPIPETHESPVIIDGGGAFDEGLPPLIVSSAAERAAEDVLGPDSPLAGAIVGMLARHGLVFEVGSAFPGHGDEGAIYATRFGLRLVELLNAARQPDGRQQSD